MLCALAGTSYSRIPFGAQRHHHHCGHFPLSRSLLPSWNATLGALCSRQLCHTRSLTVANVCLWLASLHHRDVLGSPRGSDGVPTWRPATQGQAQDHDSHAPAAKHARVRVDPLRVSSAVRDNLERDGEGGAGGKYSRAEAGGGEATGARLRASVKANGDVSLGDTDRELNFALQQARAALAATSGDGDGGDDDGEDEGEGAPGYDSGDEDEAGGGKAGEGDEGVWQPRSSPTMRAVTADGVSRQRQRPGAGAGSGAGAASDGMQPARPPGTAPGVFGGAATSKGDSGRRATFDEDGVSTESADYWENLLATLPDGGAQSATIDQVRVVGCCLARFVFSRSGMFAWFQILLHPSDVVVSSIVCNPSIEAVVVPPVKTRLLQFDALPADKVAALARRPLEAHLNQVITGLASGNPTPDRLAVLSYCFILARSAAMANFIVNSSLMALFVRMLGQRKCPVPIRARVALVMGAAVRHATFISVSLQSARVRVPLPPCRCFHGRVRAHHHPPLRRAWCRSWTCSRTAREPRTTGCGAARWACWASSCSTCPRRTLPMQRPPERVTPALGRGCGLCQGGQCPCWPSRWSPRTTSSGTTRPRRWRMCSPRAASSGRSSRRRRSAARCWTWRCTAARSRSSALRRPR